jgi:hypothetical protein
MYMDLYFDEKFVSKEDVGFVGMCISKKLLKSFVVNQEKNKTMWISDYLNF